MELMNQILDPNEVTLSKLAQNNNAFFAHVYKA